MLVLLLAHNAIAPAALGSLSAVSGEVLRITVTLNGPGATNLSLQGYRSRYAPNAS